MTEGTSVKKRTGEPLIIPLDGAGTLFAVRDAEGTFVGTGTREVCEVLLFILKSCAAHADPVVRASPVRKPNLRAAITI